jgi:Catalase
MREELTLATNAGAPADNQNAVSAGRNGRVLLIEKRAHQNRERISERTVHTLLGQPSVLSSQLIAFLCQFIDGTGCKELTRPAAFGHLPGDGTGVNF